MKQNTTEWLELRKTKIGASDVPIILGISPFKTPLQLWEEKMGIRENEMNVAMKRGHEMESEALAAYNKKTGNLCTPKVVFHPDYDFMMASIDGLSYDGFIQVEIKCPGDKDHGLALKGEVPPYYFAQVQAQLACTGNKVSHYWSYRDGEGVLLVVERDQAFIDDMIPKLRDFKVKMDIFTPPELSEKDIETRLDDAWILQAAELAETRRQIKDLKELEKQQLGELQILSNGRSCEGGGYRLVKYPIQGKIDYKAIPELEGVDLEKYRKQGSMAWRFSC